MSEPFWKNAKIYALASLFGALLHIAHVGWSFLLSPEEYGRFANMQVLFNFASSPLTLAPQAFVLAHYHKHTREKLAAALGSFLPITTSLLLLAVVAVLWLPESSLSVFGEGTSRWVVLTTLIAATLVGPKRMAAGIAEARGKAKEASAWLELADGMRPIVAVICFFALSMGWESRVVGLAVAQGGAGVLAFFLLIRAGLLRWPSQRRAPLGETMRFVLPAMFATVVYVGYDSADRLVVTHFVGLEAAGRYDLAYRIALLTQAVNVVFRRSFTPLFYKAHAAGDHEEALHVLRSTGRKLLLFTVPIAILVPAALWVLPIFDEGYQGAIPIIPVVAIGAAFWGVQMLWQQVLMADGRTGTVLWITGLGAVVNLGLNWVLVPRFAELGAAFATLACFFVMYLAVRRIGAQILRSPGAPAHAEGDA